MSSNQKMPVSFFPGLKSVVAYKVCLFK